MATFDVTRIINLTQKVNAFDTGLQSVLKPKVFGAIIEPPSLEPKQSPNFNAELDIITDPEVGKSFLNTPVYSNLVLGSFERPEENNYLDLDGNKIEYEPFRADAVIFTATKPKNIVKTAIAGRNGTVKEYISDGDYTIRVTGVIVSENVHASPVDAMNTLNIIHGVQGSLSITSAFVNNLGIDRVVIENMEIAQIQGFTNMVSLNLTMTSDFAAEIEISI